MMPTQWIQDEGLKGFRWRTGEGADNAAALMVLIVMAQHAAHETGQGDMTYGELSDCASLSRAKVSAGLKIIEGKNLILRQKDGRSSYALAGYDLTKGWGKLPAAKLYTHGHVAFFSQLHLRKPAELDALKLYLLFVARRDNKTNFANIRYEKIEDYTGIDRNRIKSGLSLLAANGMTYVEHTPTTKNQFGVANAYRLPHIDSHMHMGTVGRGMDQLAFSESSAA